MNGLIMVATWCFHRLNIMSNGNEIELDNVAETTHPRTLDTITTNFRKEMPWYFALTIEEERTMLGKMLWGVEYKAHAMD